MVRTAAPLSLTLQDGPDAPGAQSVRGLLFLLSAEDRTPEHPNLLAGLARRIDDPAFMADWLAAGNEQEIKEALLHDDRFLSLRIRSPGPAAALVGREVREIALAENALIAMVHRGGAVVIPRGRTRLKEGDRLTIIGTPDSIRMLQDRFRGS